MIREILEYDRKPDIVTEISGNDWKMTISTMNRTIPDFELLKKNRSLLDRFFNTEIIVDWSGPSKSYGVAFISHEISSLFPYFKLRYIKSSGETVGIRTMFIARIAVPRRHYSKVYKKIVQLKLSE